MDGAISPARESGAVGRLLDLAAADLAAVDEVIAGRMQSKVPLIPALAEHLIGAGGKRLRPLLTVATARMCGVSSDHHVKLAAAVEFIHTATLLHDDVVDGSELRRGRVAANLIWGAPPSVLVGDYLFARAFGLMVETRNLKALDVLARAASVIAEGEVLQLTRSNDLALDQATYLEIITAKTAELFAAAAEGGGIAAEASDTETEALRRFGLNFGLAFQVIDDVLDLRERGVDLGKPTGQDLRQGNVTLPTMLYAAGLRPGSPEAERLRAIVAGDLDDQTAIDAVAADIRASGAIDAAIDVAASYVEQAKRCVASVPSMETRELLEELADFALTRSS